MDEAREWRERGEGEMELGREGGVVVLEEDFAEAGQDFEGKVCQGGMRPFGEDSEDGRPGIDGARLEVGFQVQSAQFARRKVREERLCGGRRRADSEGSKGREESGIRTGGNQSLVQVGYVYGI